MTDKNKLAISILIIEDDPVLNHQLKQLLEQQNFTVTQRFNGEEGLLTAISGQFDLILLDVSLPARNGYSVLSILRQIRQTPVIILTAHGAEEERIIGFKNGADDYLPKPFNFTELVLRIEAILRRAGIIDHSHQEDSVLQHEGLKLDRKKQRAYFHEHDVQLTPIQFKLLWTLTQHANHLHFIERLKNVKTSQGDLDKPGYAIHDLYAQWLPMQSQDLRVTLTVNNLFDKDYLNHATNADFSQFTDFENIIGLPDPGRDVRLSVAWQF